MNALKLRIGFAIAIAVVLSAAAVQRPTAADTTATVVEHQQPTSTSKSGPSLRAGLSFALRLASVMISSGQR